MQLELFDRQPPFRLKEDLFRAYFDARRNKRNTLNALAFERDFERNVLGLADEIFNRSYTPRPGICFIVDKPVKREIFAADFRDRVVHHYIFNQLSPLFEKRFIYDTYSCRTGKGTSCGIKRVIRFIRSCSENYRRDCYILKLDISGYFMSIRRERLFAKVLSAIEEELTGSRHDVSTLTYLLVETIFNDPTSNSTIKGKPSDWRGLPKSKSLFHAANGCGLPIGNITSQLFGNVYLNEFDHFVKRDLGIRYYGRYVDDMVLISPDQAILRSLIPKIDAYLSEQLALRLHRGKIYLQHFSKGVKFLGAVIKPYRTTVAKRTKGNFRNKLHHFNRSASEAKPTPEVREQFRSYCNSYLGLLGNYNTYRLRKSMWYRHTSGWWHRYFYMDRNCLVIKPRICSASRIRPWQRMFSEIS